MKLYPALVATRDSDEDEERWTWLITLGLLCWPVIYQQALRHAVAASITRALR